MFITLLVALLVGSILETTMDYLVNINENLDATFLIVILGVPYVLIVNMVRRTHDIGHPGQRCFLALVLLYGLIFLL